MTFVSKTYVNLEEQGAAPSPLHRVFLTFAAPSRAFQQLGSGGSWWLPYLLVVVCSIAYGATIGSRVGWETVARNSLASSPKQQARMDQLPAAQQQQQLAVIARITRTMTFAGSVLGPLIFAAVIAGLLLASLNFGLGGTAHFGPLLAVYFFSSLPQVIKLLLVISLLFLSLGTDTFQMSNPLGSNPAFYLQGSAIPHFALSVLSWLDVFVIWQLVLLATGCAIVARISWGKSAAIVFGWTLTFIAIGGAFTLLS